MPREKILTVTIHDCEVQAFRAGGPGGQKQNKTSSAVRVKHAPSGAVAECRTHREQHRNKREAFIKMVNTPAFKYWVEVQTTRIESEEAYLERMMKPENIKVEVRQGGRWVVSEELNG